MIPAYFFAQTTVTGTVTEEGSNMPIPGVNVIIKDSTTGTTTDFDGNYSLDNVNQGDVLVFSYVGYLTREIAFTGQTSINVALPLDAAVLDEVVLVGYGSTTKKDLTGSVTSITTEDFNEGNIVTAENLLAGRAAGVQIITDGAPGGGANIQIRGATSLNAGSAPLIVVDGLPLQGGTADGSRSFLSTLNPNDIKSFNILKDASATAIYGNRASGGVIIIETKKGTSTLNATFDQLYNVNVLPNLIENFSASEYRNIISDRFPERLSELGEFNTDWQRAIYQQKLGSITNASVSGSIANILPARLSMNLTNQPGARKTSEFQRYTSSLALNPTFFDGNLRFDLNANYAIEENRFADAVERGSLTFDPTQPIFADGLNVGAGFFEYTNPDGTLAAANAPKNPLALLDLRNNRSNVKRLFGNLKTTVKFPWVEGLSATLNLGFDETRTRGTNELDRRSAAGVRLEIDGQETLVGSKTDYADYRRNRNLNATLNYKTGEDFTVDLTAGYDWQRFDRSGFNSGEQRDLDTDFDNFTEDDVQLLGFLGRANFGYLGKYLVTLNYRYDGTSRFSEDNRWDGFAGGSLAWNIAEEEFLKDNSTLSLLKLRLGYGETGNQAINAGTLFLNRYRFSQGTSQYIFGGETFPVAVPLVFNPDIRWEKQTEYNIGLDYGLFADRIIGSFDIFQRNTTDLIVFSQLEEGNNFSNRVDRNVGELETRGFEANVDIALVQKSDFNWNVNYNFTYLDQEIVDLDGDIFEVGGISGGTGLNIQVQQEGVWPNSFLVYNQLYDDNGNPIQGAFSDLNGDGIINADDRYVYQNPSANVIMGFQSQLNYKNLDFSFNLRANLNNYVYNNVESDLAEYRALLNNNFLGNIPTSVLNSNFESTDGNQIFSDYYVRNASFLRMDNVTLGYTFDISEKRNSKMRLSTGVQNVFVLTDYNGLDPEISGGIDNTIYPRARTYLFGIRYTY
ncbi:TonB-dependent receptor [Gangjinia marincola]|uniref:TonB-dependent receptor n=2 Tax=Gangjinia marincola TaxID=578463 RepID=A0ABP3XWE7_9FLAO